jgi:hypothetical protein
MVLVVAEAMVTMMAFMVLEEEDLGVATKMSMPLADPAMAAVQATMTATDPTESPVPVPVRAAIIWIALAPLPATTTWIGSRRWSCRTCRCRPRPATAATWT